jgi:murein DD-endopeptidase MepM/ murein hydrolase activator NlpD
MTRYGYLSSITVAVGQNVNQGQLIAYSGSTGECSEAGLRFELWIGGTTVNPVNYVNKN